MFSFFKKDTKKTDELNKQVITLKTKLSELEKEHETAFQERLNLKQEIADLQLQKKKEVEELKLERKTSEEEIKHMVKLHDEKVAVQFERKEIEMERKKNDEIAKVKDEYRDKLEKQLAQETANIKEMYGQILARLPNVNVKLGGSLT